MTARPRVLLAPVALVMAAMAGCVFWPDHTLDEGAPDQFIALPSSFTGFEQWPSFHVDAEATGEGHAHLDRTVWASVVVEDGAFAVGSMIVKGGVNTEDPDELHAMVKRGGRFNEDGARGWEWFELHRGTNDGVVIAWRGLDAPDGECYGLLPGQPCDASSASCNACHAGAAGNDFVQSAALDLHTLEGSALAP